MFICRERKSSHVDDMSASWSATKAWSKPVSATITTAVPAATSVIPTVPIIVVTIALTHTHTIYSSDYSRELTSQYTHSHTHFNSHFPGEPGSTDRPLILLLHLSLTVHCYGTGPNSPINKQCLLGPVLILIIIN